MAVIMAWEIDEMVAWMARQLGLPEYCKVDPADAIYYVSKHYEGGVSSFVKAHPGTLR